MTEVHDAQLHDGPSPRPARVRLVPDGVEVSAAGEPPRTWAFAGLVLVRGQARGEPVQLEHRGEAVQVLLVSDPGFRVALLAAWPRALRRRGLGGPRVTGRTIVAGVVLAVLGLVAAWRFGLPSLADSLASRVPRSWEAEYGRQVMADLAPEVRRLSDPRVVGPPHALFDRLVEVGAAGGEPATLFVVRDELVNAFAAPGGSVVVTSGLLRTLRSPDELAAVLAHELGHVRRRHALRGLLRNASVQVLFGLLAGDGTVLSTSLQAVGGLGELSHSREQEREADRDALDGLERAGLPAAALVSALERIASVSPDPGVPGFLSTHPTPPDRIEGIRRLLRTRPPVPARPVVDDAAWQAMHGALPSREPGR